MGKARPRKKGFRQGHLKRFHAEVINAGQRFNPKAAAEHFQVFSGAGRAKSIATAGFAEPNRAQQRQSAVLNLEPEDIVVVRMLDLWPQDYWPKGTTFHRINLLLSHDRNLFLFFSAMQEMFFFVAEYPQQKKLKRSIVYHSRRAAYMHMDAGKITWIEKKDLNIPLLDARPVGLKLDLESFPPR